jgi:hypothetical protein
VDLNQPCPECFREEDGKWFYPCPSDDCILHDARLIAAAPDLLEALRYLLADHQRMFTEAHPNSTIAWRDCEEVKEAKAAIQKATQP